MRLPVYPKMNKLSPGHARLKQSTGPITSLNEAWFCTVDISFVDGPFSEIILHLLRNRLFGGANACGSLAQRGHRDELTSDILSFIIDETRS